MRRLLRVVRRGVDAVRWPVVVGIGGGLLLVAVLLAVIVFAPQLAIDPRGLSRTDWLKAVQDLRTSILQGLGGLAVLTGAVVAALNLRETSRQNRAVLELQRRGQTTERFTKAIEQLGEQGPDKLAVRLGGIYALEQIALDSEELHWPVMEVLTAFLRENSATPSARSVIDTLDAFEHGQPLSWPPEEAESMQPKLATDLQAIATVLGRRPEQRRRHEWGSRRRLDLSGVWLPKAMLQDAHLERANLSGAHLEWSFLMWAHLEDAQLFGAHLNGARLVNAHLEQAQMGGLSEFGEESAHLKDALLTGAHLEGAFLDETDLTSEQLEMANIDSKTVLPKHLQGKPAAADC